MTREEICNSMTVQDAVRVLKETNCYGTMDIAKSVIIKALEQQSKERTEKRTETHARDCVSKKGHWITQWNVTHQKEYYYCSECREEFSYDGETGIKMNDYSYCPNCGSCNRGRKE